MKKLTAFILAGLLILCMAAPAFAEEGSETSASSATEETVADSSASTDDTATEETADSTGSEGTAAEETADDTNTEDAAAEESASDTGADDTTADSSSDAVADDAAAEESSSDANSNAETNNNSAEESSATNGGSETETTTEDSNSTRDAGVGFAGTGGAASIRPAEITATYPGSGDSIYITLKNPNDVTIDLTWGKVLQGVTIDDVSWVTNFFLTGDVLGAGESRSDIVVQIPAEDAAKIGQAGLNTFISFNVAYDGDVVNSTAIVTASPRGGVGSGSAGGSGGSGSGKSPKTGESALPYAVAILLLGAGLALYRKKEHRA